MIDYESLVGKTYNNWLILSYLGRINKEQRCLCKCLCEKGTVRPVNLRQVITGKSTSCGCNQKEIVRKRSVTHNMSKTRLYRIWKMMRDRCNKESMFNFDRYGGRGIKVCDEWQQDFMPFYTWSMENGYTEVLTIDRIDNNGNYEPLNCRWATVKQQNNNSSFNRIVTIDDTSMTLSECSEKYGVPYKLLCSRLRQGWSMEEALTRKKLKNCLKWSIRE